MCSKCVKSKLLVLSRRFFRTFDSNYIVVIRAFITKSAIKFMGNGKFKKQNWQKRETILAERPRKRIIHLTVIL